MSVLARLLHRDAGSEVIVEPARRRHLPAIMSIEAVSYPRPWSQQVFLGELALVRPGQRIYLVARQGHEPLAYAGMMLQVDEAHISNIAVHPDHRRTGLATRLLAEMMWAALDRGRTAMTLEVRHTNVAAQRLYETFGFESAGIRQRYYENTDDAIVMWCREMDSDAHQQRLRVLCPEAAR
jgi:[ribosomal protein S18]-alanine N-acetyltransferase